MITCDTFVFKTLDENHIHVDTDTIIKEAMVLDTNTQMVWVLNIGTILRTYSVTKAEKWVLTSTNHLLELLFLAGGEQVYSERLDHSCVKSVLSMLLLYVIIDMLIKIW